MGNPMGISGGKPDGFFPISTPTPCKGVGNGKTEVGNSHCRLGVGKEGSGNVILALDPGTTQTGWVLFDGERVLEAGVMPNALMLERLQTRRAEVLAIEMIASYGMAVGREVFETCVWIGRFQQAWHAPESVRLVYRKDVKSHLCGSPRAKDPNVRQALIDLFPPTGGGKVRQVGTKAQPGPLYGVSSHAWPALGVAVTVRAQLEPA